MQEHLRQSDRLTEHHRQQLAPVHTRPPGVALRMRVVAVVAIGTEATTEEVTIARVEVADRIGTVQHTISLEAVATEVIVAVDPEVVAIPVGMEVAMEAAMEVIAV